MKPKTEQNRKTDRRKWLKCSGCETKKESTRDREDPYASEINDDHRLFPICDDCYEDSCLSI